MTISKELLDIMLVLTPGVIAFYIIESLTHHKRIEYQRVILNIIVLNFMIYLMIYLFAIGLNKHFPIVAQNWHLSTDHILAKNMNIGLMILGLFFATLFGLIISRAINEKYLYKLAKQLKVSDLDSNLNVWDDFLSEKRDFEGVIVRDLENNIMYYGIPKRYSEFSHDKKELHLEDVRIFSEQEAEELYRQDELYLVINDKMTIEIPKIERNNDE
ncbi:MAG TPA: hypothetical protein EYG73_03115 [Arcobacter sp.]|nr:hypothetical protein [Arcobacter sp.]